VWSYRRQHFGGDPHRCPGRVHHQKRSDGGIVFDRTGPCVCSYAGHESMRKNGGVATGVLFLNAAEAPPFTHS
jgi:hypothetical protein